MHIILCQFVLLQGGAWCFNPGKVTECDRINPRRRSDCGECLQQHVNKNPSNAIYIKQVIRIQKLVGLLSVHSNYLGNFLGFRRNFAEVILLGGASTQKFYSKL